MNEKNPRSALSTFRRILLSPRENYCSARFTRVSTGSYGKCLRCGQEIPIARLCFLPATRFAWSAPKREKTLSLLAARLRNKNKLRRAESVPRGKGFFLLLIGNREICCLP
ncbi:MAG: hypothetical protein A3G40_09515 [Deltaproteobacteria bacterium RIFCSPLOWO2_12_FULL_57_22]|nr:MAG: hypothetical protein A3G40_09515 [Deltaproteobacteria bacterium RIFCSPLOWO2_12_FULL_57_22]